jgi:hypothetical protein
MSRSWRPRSKAPAASYAHRRNGPRRSDFIERSVRGNHFDLLNFRSCAGTGHASYSRMARTHLASRAGRAQPIQVVRPGLHHAAALREMLRIVVVSADGV